jgi:two-component system, NarL family, invasion response regulator UvrY
VRGVATTAIADSSRLEILVVVRYLEAAVDYLQREHGIDLLRSKLLAHHLLRLNTVEFNHVETLAVDLHVAAGAAGYMNKQSAPQQLTIAIRMIAEGGTCISAGLAATLARGLSAKPADTVNELLSDREFAVLRDIANGKQIAEIAREMNLSAKTVSTYRTRLMTKLGLHSNVELARYASENNLVK